MEKGVGVSTQLLTMAKSQSTEMRVGLRSSPRRGAKVGENRRIE